jgi:hypothetical protein
MNLYYLVGRDDNGDDYTLHVRAPNMFQAHAMWLKHWDTEIYTGQLVSGSPAAKADEKLLVYELIFDPDELGVIEWGRDAIIVGYVEP